MRTGGILFVEDIPSLPTNPKDNHPHAETLGVLGGIWVLAVGCARRVGLRCGVFHYMEQAADEF